MKRFSAHSTRHRFNVLAALGLSLVTLQACSQDAPTQAPAPKAAVSSVSAEVPADVEAAIREALGGIDEALTVESVEASVMPGLYAVQFKDGPVVYAPADGSHFVLGELYRVEADGFTNLAEERRAEERMAMMGDVATQEAIVFAAEGEKRASISVFTDINCGYCRKLHTEVPALNAAGVEVRYLAYPRGFDRAGEQGNDFQKLATSWCAEDPQTTLTRYKNGEAVPIAVCDDNPVAEQFALGVALGVRGTPAILLESGKLLPGYQSAEEMLKTLGLED